MSTAVSNTSGAGGANKAASASKGAKQTPFTGIAPGRKSLNSFMGALMWLCMIIALIPLLWLLLTVIMRGAPAVFDIGWWTDDMVGVRMSKEGGGALHAIAGTLMQTLIASIISIPIGVFTAIYLVEYSNGNKLGRLTTFMVDILSGVPSIVAALFIYALWITILGMDRSGFAVSLSLILLMVPLVVRNTEEMLRVVPMDLREASYACLLYTSPSPRD